LTPRQLTTPPQLLIDERLQRLVDHAEQDIRGPDADEAEPVSHLRRLHSFVILLATAFRRTRRNPPCALIGLVVASIVTEGVTQSSGIGGRFRGRFETPKRPTEPSGAATGAQSVDRAALEETIVASLDRL
jgi:hypothetical protein